MNIISKITRISLAVGILFIFSFAVQLTPTQAAGTCNLTAGQVVINEIFPKATGGLDWVELYNTTASPLDLSNCYIDDIASAGSSPIQIAAGNTIPAHGFWTLDRSSYFNNGGDDVRLLLHDASTVLDAYTYADTVSYDYSWYRNPDGGPWAGTPTASPTKGTSNSGASCGTGTWTSGNLEIHHINIGQGDSALIVGPTGRTLLFDAGESNWNSSAKAQIIGPYIQAVLGCKSLNYVVVSHFHLDHIGYVGYGGLWNLVETQGFSVGTTLVRNYNSYLGDKSTTFDNWKTYLEGAGQAKLHPVTAVEGAGQVDLGLGVTFDIIAVDGNGAIFAGNFSGDASPPSENDYSIGALLSYGNFDEWIGGDLDGQYEVGGFGYTYHDIELSAAPEVGDVDVYKVNHHASSHSTSPTFIGQIDPEVSIVTVGDGNTYGHPTQDVMNRLLGTSTVYMTERGNIATNIGSAIVAGNIVIKTSNGSSYTVNGTPYTATEPVRTDSDGDGYFAEVDPADNNAGSIPAPNGGCDPIYQTCSAVSSCQVVPGQVVINEVLPAPSSGSEWVELYNTTGSMINIGNCYIDDIPAGSPAYQIPAGTTIPGYGFWTLDRTTYFNNTGDDVRFLKEDASTVLDSYSFGNTGSNLSWYRLTDGGTWAGSPTASPTKGQSNNPLSADTTGVFRPSNGLLYLKNTNLTGFADVAINYGLGGDYPVTGDWDGNGTDTIGIYRNGSFYLRNSNTLGFADLVFPFGMPGDQPIAGDWNGDGADTIGVYRSSTGAFYLRNSNTSGAPDVSFYLGNVGDVGIAGDWDADGVDTTGVFRPSNGVIFLKNANTTGFADVALNYGLPGDQPVTGDWDNDGIDTIGVYRNGQFMLRNSNTIGFADIVFGLGNPGDMPIGGNWDGLP